jgi:nucleotide-binding universal stress UspA family protein
MTSSSDRAHPRLVLGDDGTEPSDVAWGWVAAHPWPEWSIDVLTADETSVPWGEHGDPEEWKPTWERTVEIPGDPTVRFLTVATDPRAMLAEAGDADLMVVGLRSHSYLEAMVTGSTSEWLLHHPPAPLVVASAAATVEDVVVCTDGSPHAAAALETFTSLPLAAKARVTVLAIADGRTDAAAAAHSAVDAVSGKAAGVDTRIVEGPATETILEHLSANLPQLVVLGTRGLTGWKRLRLGSTAAAVVRAAPCSSLVACVDS